MRLCYIDRIEDGMLLGMSIYDRTSRLLLKKDTELSLRYISILKSKNIQYIFIEDELSKGIEISPLISDKVKYNLIGHFENFITQTLKKIPTIKKTFYDRFKYSIDNNAIKLLNHKELRLFINDVLYDIQSLKHEKRYFRYYKSDLNFSEISFDILVVSLLIGLHFEYGTEEITQLGIAALFHDIGWIFSPNYIIKEQKLSSQEVDDELHATYGYKFLRESKHLTALEYIPAIEHHEYADGSGFPNKKKSDLSFPSRDRKEGDDQIFRFSEIIGTVSELINRCQFESAVDVLIDFRKNKNIKYNSYVINALDAVFNPYSPGVEVSFQGFGDKFETSGIVLDNVAPTFIPSIKTFDFTTLHAEETSRYKINII